MRPRSSSVGAREATAPPLIAASSPLIVSSLPAPYPSARAADGVRRYDEAAVDEARRRVRAERRGEAVARRRNGRMLPRAPCNSPPNTSRAARTPVAPAARLTSIAPPIPARATAVRSPATRCVACVVSCAIRPVAVAAVAATSAASRIPPFAASLADASTSRTTSITPTGRSRTTNLTEVATSCPRPRPVPMDLRAAWSKPSISSVATSPAALMRLDATFLAAAIASTWISPTLRTPHTIPSRAAVTRVLIASPTCSRPSNKRSFAIISTSCWDGSVLWVAPQRVNDLTCGAARMASPAAAPEQCEERRLVEHRRPELLRFRELRARVGARDDVVGLLRDAARDAAAGGDDAALGLAARQRIERAGEHDRLAGEDAGRCLRRLRRDAGLQESRDDGAIVTLAREAAHARRDLGPDAVHREQVFLGRVHDRADVAKAVGENLRQMLADVADAERVEKAVERGFLLRSMPWTMFAADFSAMR